MKLLLSLRIDLIRTLTAIVFVTGPISTSAHLASAAIRDTAPLISRYKAANASLRANPTFIDLEPSPERP